MTRISRHWTALLALVLLAVGLGLVILGLVKLWPRLESIPASPSATATDTPPPTATEPILPPPPTRSQTPVPPSVSTITAASSPAPGPSSHDGSPTGQAMAAGEEQPSVEFSSTPPASASPRSGRTVVAARVLATEISSQPPSPVAALTPPPAAVTLPTPAPQAAPSPVPAASPSPAMVPVDPEPLSLRARLGVCGGGLAVDQALADRLGFGWHLDWRVSPDAFRSSRVEYAPMIRLKGGVPTPGGDVLLAAVDAMPGALWLIGNEPDVKWQDGVPPERYAQQYHDIYALIKKRDPAAPVAIGGVSQPTPLRLRYLDRILAAYHDLYGEPMPVDVWNVHNFVLREERDSWGVDIPPGMPDDAGRLYEIADHDDLGIFRQQIVDFRRWMAGRGQRGKPLIVTEYGILMPSDYGFPPDQVQAFMTGSFEFFRTAADPALGFPADGNRLVQRWCWYSLSDERYPTGNLLQTGSRQLTPLGEAFRRYSHASP